MPETSPDNCPRCGDLLIDGKLFCPNCGLAIVATPERVAVDAYVDARVRQAVESRMADESILVRKIADDAEDIVRSRIKKNSWIVAGFLALLGLYGITSIRDAKSTIVNEAHNRLDPVISDTESRVKTAQHDIADTSSKISSVKKQLDDTSTLAQAQSSRINGQAGEINAKLQQVQSASDRATALSKGYEKQAADFQQELQAMRKNADAESRRLEEMQKTYNAKIDEVTKQVDNVSIQRAYPDLERKMYVTYNGQPWAGLEGKKPSEKWVNINLNPYAIGEGRITTEELQTLAAQLEKNGYKPLPGFFGVGGRLATGFGCLTPGFQDRILYFDSKHEQDAAAIQKMVSEALHLSGFQLDLVDKQTTESVARFVIENSGLDFEVCIGHKF